MTSMGEVDEVARFLSWFGAQTQYAARVLIAGNHDFLFERDPDIANRLLPDTVTYLQNSGASLLELRFWGSPVTPYFQNWAFNQHPKHIGDTWAFIPQDVDVLVTHGPPYEILDRVSPGGESVGCPRLRQRVEVIRPSLHVFGHIHEERGEEERDGTRFVNASVLDERYEVRYAPFVVDVNVRQARNTRRQG